MASKLLLIRWLAGIAFWLGSILYSSVPLFWFAIHPFAARWRRMQRSPYRWLLPLWGVSILALAWAAWPWHGRQLYSSLWMYAPAVILFAVGLRTYREVAVDFSLRKFSGEAELRPEEHEQRLVTNGMHARMRHPIYFAHLCNLAGCAVGSGLLIPFVLLAISAFVTFPVMIWLEERELAKRFGQEFHDYKKAVPLFPKFFFSSPDAKTGPEKIVPGLTGSSREV
jgi:protein-S-isoprenylcysteine O-methyltransferase Ste14